MFLNLSKSVDWSLKGALIYFAVLPQAKADMDYFSQPIDYWNKSESSQSEAAVKPVSPTLTPVTEKTRFDWGKYLNPENKEFFQEGDYTPPAPFMEVARNPSDANLKNWFEYTKKKNDLADRLQRRMAQFAGTPAPTDELRIKPALNVASQAEPHSPVDPSRFRLRIYFDSHCPHCHHMFDTLTALRDQGFKIEALQVDSDRGAAKSFPLPSERATQDDLLQKHIDAVPVLLIGDLKKHVVYRVPGYHSKEEILDELRREVENKAS